MEQVNSPCVEEVILTLPSMNDMLTSDCRCRVDATGPLGYSKVLMVQVLLRAVQYGRRAFRSISVLEFTVSLLL